MSAAGERARLFVALDLPESARAALVRWREPLLVAHPELRAVAEESLHVTLCFLGARPVEEIAGLAALVGGAAGDVRGLSWGEALWLAPRRPGVLAVALADGAGALATAQRALASALVEGGCYEPESRPFLAHVTVARVRRSARLRNPAAPAPPPPLRFAGAGVTLYRSRPQADGARYEPLARAGGGLAHLEA